MTGFLNRRYGAGPLHLIAHVAAFAIAGYALAQILNGGSIVNFIGWFAGAAVLHDIVFLPLYSVLDRLAGHGIRARVSERHAPVINHLRAPALISGLLLLVYFPLILGSADHNYFRASGHHVAGYARNWLLITAALFAGSAVIYAIRVNRHKRAQRASDS